MRLSGPQSVCEFKTLPSAVAFFPATITVQAWVFCKMPEAMRQNAQSRIFFTVIFFWVSYKDTYIYPIMSEVFYTNLHASPGNSLPKKFKKLIKAAGIESMDCKNAFVAIKIHFGELGNMAFLRHNYAQRLSEVLTEMGAKPFLTDSNTLYSGTRSNAIDHIHTANLNGFNAISVPSAPVIIADGLKGTDYVEVPVPCGTYCKEAKIGSAIAKADAVISLSHFKGHEQTSFGGALKNLGMGSASVGGKLHLHSDSQPTVNRDNCVGCGQCEANCRHGAIRVAEDGVAAIDKTLCVGCGQCIAVCQFDAAAVDSWSSSQGLSAKISEYAWAVVNGKPNFHIALITNVSPLCDCWGCNDVPIVPDLGMLASFDPVALDQACFDMVLKAEALAGSEVNPDGRHTHKDENKFHIVHPTTDGLFGLEHAEKIGLGTRAYTLTEV